MPVVWQTDSISSCFSSLQSKPLSQELAKVSCPGLQGLNYRWDFTPTFIILAPWLRAAFLEQNKVFLLPCFCPCCSLLSYASLPCSLSTCSNA